MITADAIKEKLITKLEAIHAVRTLLVCTSVFVSFKAGNLNTSVFNTRSINDVCVKFLGSEGCF